MRMTLLLFSLLAVSIPASARGVQLKGGTVSIGDPVLKLLEVAGKPDRVKLFPGAPAFTVYEYALGSRQVNVSIKDGKITGIADNSIVSK